MSLSFLEIRQLVAPYAGRAGKDPKHPDVAKFARDVMQYVLISGASGAVRKLELYAVNGSLVLPPEVETPLKARIEGEVVEVLDKWCTFHSGASDMDSCAPASSTLVEDGAQTPLVYPLPRGGSQIGVIAHCDEEEGAHLIVAGKDTTGREVYTVHNGVKIIGEKLSLKKNEMRYGQVTFGEVTSVLKSATNGYVGLFAVDPDIDARRFLADYAPSEQKPLYRRFKIRGQGCGRYTKIAILCRIRLKDVYYDNDVTIFDSGLAITLGAQRVQSEVNNSSNQANYKMQAMEDVLEKEAGYKKISGRPLDVYVPLSGGSIKGIV